MGMYITVTGVYNHYPNLFELMQLPEGVDMETARDNILFQCGELELVYSEPSFLRAMIGNWSKRRAYKWKTLQGTTTLEYEPLENYDRQETWTDGSEETGSYTENKTGSQNSSTSQNSTSSGNSTTEGGSTGNSDKLEKRKGFEGGDLVETAGETVNDSTSENAKTDTTANVDTTETGETEVKDDTEGSNTKKTDYTHTGRVHGNIGVTTSQQMLMSERDVADFSIYDVIAQDFAREFCLYVY